MLFFCFLQFFVFKDFFQCSPVVFCFFSLLNVFYFNFSKILKNVLQKQMEFYELITIRFTTNS